MGTGDHDLASIETQLTAARWHLDAAAGAAADALRRELSLQRARQVYESIVRALARLSLTLEQREQLDRELSVLRSRLEAAGNVG